MNAESAARVSRFSVTMYGRSKEPQVAKMVAVAQGLKKSSIEASSRLVRALELCRSRSAEFGWICQLARRSSCLGLYPPSRTFRASRGATREPSIMISWTLGRWIFS